MVPRRVLPPKAGDDDPHHEPGEDEPQHHQPPSSQQSDHGLRSSWCTVHLTGGPEVYVDKFSTLYCLNENISKIILLTCKT